ncbi:uncharacterized protein LOC112589682 [Harpegnathos saltator]|uniref:uncharacterized protein LOC112589682 n=1 Tax=Harpegnathos saltator TaxID=610380 RepID=UPI000DBEDCB6|nr:uncharacterized protein LOC112589682 [Harpegnathos saltator]
MEHFEKRYCKLYQFSLTVSGLCPYQSIRKARMIRAFITILILSSVFVQLMSIFTSKFTMDFFIIIIPAFIPTLGTLIHLYMRAMRMDELKGMFDRIRDDWALQKTDDEVKIMYNSAATSRLFTCFFMRKGNVRFRFTYKRKICAYAPFVRSKLYFRV